MLRTLEGHADKVGGVALTQDGLRAVSASEDDTLKVWDVESGEVLRTLNRHADRVNGVAVMANGRWACSVSDDKTLRVWDLSTGLTVATLEVHAPLTCCAATSNGRILAGDRAGALHILDWLTPTAPAHAPPPVLRPSPPPPALTPPPAPVPLPRTPTRWRPPPPMLQVTGTQYGELTNALAKAFPTRARLERMLQFRLAKSLNEIAGEGIPLLDALFQVIQDANAQAWTLDLVTAARASNPGNPQLLVFCQSLGLAPATPPHAELERLIRRTNSYLDVHAFRTRLGEIEAQVCRVEVGAGPGRTFGTGFLVGPTS